MKRSLLGWILLCILSTVTPSFGQTATTSLRGTVKDPSGALVPGAKVTITDKANGKIATATSNSAGLYTFTQISPSNYTITVSSAGFGEQSKTAELLVAQPATVDFALTVQSNSVTIDVSAAAQTLNTSDASLGNSADTAEIQALPSETRNVPDLLSLQPGVLYLPPTITDSRSGAVNGGRSDQGNVTIDGVDDNDQVGGLAFSGVLRETQDSIEEFRVVTGNSNADAGRSSGAQVSMVTKSGTNKFHGSAYEYHRPTFTVANDWFNKQAQKNGGKENVPGKLVRNIFGGALGGPLVKDKVFFFGNFEANWQAENRQVNRTVPTATYQQGQIIYQADQLDGTVVNQTLTASQIATLDAGCQICNTSSYPFGPGPNPNALAYLNSMPAANGSTLGDALNTGSYSFSSPHPIRENTSIVRFDYVPTGKHRLFLRGSMQDDRTNAIEQFPGQGPSSVYASNNKGIVVGDTWTISSNMVNDLRLGYIRQSYSNRGVGKGDYVDFRFLSNATAETRTDLVSVPVDNIIDNLSWSKGNHTIQLGGNWRRVQQNHSSDANSFNNATTNPYWLGGNPPDPTTIGALPVDGGFGNSYEIAFANLVGTVPQLTNVYNYQLTSASAGNLLADGTFLNRHFRDNEFEWYVQDAWRVKPNLTITFGVRHTILQTPWETKGQEVAPTIDTHTWFLQREAAAQAGQVYEADLSFQPAGKFYNKPGFWPKSKNNFAPRLAIAYSPDTKTSIRAGAGIYYDHYGQALVSTFDQNGSYGLNGQVSNFAGNYGIEGSARHPASPRFTGRSTLPPIDNGAAATTLTFPYAAPQGNFAITWGLDSKIKTPYSETFDLSVQRQLPAGFTVEAAYVGRMGRHLLQQLDLAEPVNFVDPGGGGDYYTAGTQLSKLVDQNGGNYGVLTDSSGNASASVVNVPAIPYFENLFPFMAGVDYSGESATQAIYNNEWAPYRSQFGATSALADIDFYCAYGCPAGYQSKFWQDQFSSLYALSSIGMSYYNAAQITLRHPSSHGLQMDFSYTLSKSIDMGSDSERSSEFGSNAANTGAFSEILNTWKPQLNRGVSDFDTRHLITADYVYQLPVGRRKMLLGSGSGLLDELVGGWQLSGISRWSSGLPFSFNEPGWTTNWQQESFGVVTGKVKMRRHYDQHGNPQFFDDPAAINAGIATGGPIRLPYPGEAGQRNNFRGDGYFDLDSGLAKSWKIHELSTLKFAWEVYNVTNTVRFDPASIGSGLTSGNLGIAGTLLTVPRRMQFSLRYDF